MLGAGVPGGIYPTFKPFQLSRNRKVHCIVHLARAQSISTSRNEVQLPEEMIFVTMFLDVMQYNITSSLRPSSVSKTQ